MDRILSIKLTISQIIFRWFSRIIFCFFIGASIYHFDENRSGMIMLVIIFSLFIIWMGEEEILIYDKSFIFQKRYCFNLIRVNKIFQYSEIYETDAAGNDNFSNALNRFCVAQNDKKNIIIKTRFHLRELEKAKLHINKQIEIYKKR